MQEPSPVGNASIMRVVSPPSYHVRRDAAPRCRLRRFPNLRHQNPNRILAPESNCSRKLSTCARR
ncbi:putative isrso11-transposase orfa protein [Burkholderia pseudomallei]|nr:putative isrso11-transposase orfa protein [Burkholderia pseudomallei]